MYCIFSCLGLTVQDPLKRMVENENIKQLEKLQGEKRVFLAGDSFICSLKLIVLQRILLNIPIFYNSWKRVVQLLHLLNWKLELKVCKSQCLPHKIVILLRNLSFDKGLVNGARGCVIGFEETGKQLPIVKFSSGHTQVIEMETWNIEIGFCCKCKIDRASGGTIMATRKQIPLRLAWALSIHKSQGKNASWAMFSPSLSGMTIDRVVLSLANTFEFGMCYVALSRATSLKGEDFVMVTNDSRPSTQRLFPRGDQGPSKGA